MSKERLYTREEVSEIVRKRVNKLNKRIEELELELSILKMEREAKKENGRTNFKRFKRK